MANTISFFGKRKGLAFLDKRSFKTIARQTCENHGKTIGNINFVLVSDEALLQINRDHLQHDYYTDIITFDLSDNTQTIDAEIYISEDRVIENGTQNKNIENEFLRVLFHGILHLCGYKDKTQAEEKVMRAKEDHCITLYREIAKTK